MHAKAACPPFFLVLLLASTAFAAPSPTLPPDHWAVRAAQRLHELGVVQGYLPAQRAVPLAEVERALDEGLRNAPPELRATIQGWRDGLRSDFRRSAQAPGVDARAQAGTARRRLALPSPPGTPPPAFIQAPEAPAPWALGGELAFTIPYLAGGADLGFTSGGFQARRWELVTGLGPFSLAAGRRELGYGPAQGILFSGAVPMDGLELSTHRPIRLPGPFARLGLFAFDLTFARLEDARHLGGAGLFAASASLRPHPRLTLGAHRAVMFGSDGRPIALADYPMLLTATRNSRENNLISGSFEWRLPTEAALPLTLYGEWGTDDGGQAPVNVPGLSAGLRTPSLPGLALVSAGVEAAHFGEVWRRHLAWYKHSAQVGGWVAEETPLGHPLGGNGRELRAWAHAPLFATALELGGAAFYRRRFVDNLYAPSREGDSLGGELELRWSPARRLELTLQAGHEAGAAWRQTTAQGELELNF